MASRGPRAWPARLAGGAPAALAFVGRNRDQHEIWAVYTTRCARSGFDRHYRVALTVAEQQKHAVRVEPTRVGASGSAPKANETEVVEIEIGAADDYVSSTSAGKPAETAPKQRLTS